MRSSLPRKSRDVVSGLCSACAKQRRRLATIDSSSSSSASRSYYSTTTTARRSRISTTAAALPVPRNRRASSSSPSSSAPATTTPTSPPTQPAYFYSLFPQTLKAGPPPGGPFEIVLPALRREFLRLQAAAHPDVFHHAAPRGGGRTTPAHAASATLNVAHRTLASPLLRAQYLLRELHGVGLAAAGGRGGGGREGGGGGLKGGG